MLYIEKFQVKGFTFQIKDKLKQLGCKWNNEFKVWICNSDNKNTVQQLLDEVNLKIDDNIKEQWKNAMLTHNYDRVKKGTVEYENVYSTFKKNLSSN